MTKVEIFDPPMCCPTGVCGPAVDPALPRFAADLDWLTTHGVDVHRYNLTQDPDAFIANTLALDVLQRVGADGLPLILIDGEPVSQGRYPTRAELGAYTGLNVEGADESPAMMNCLNALCAGKVVIICVQAGGPEERGAALRGVYDFAKGEQNSKVAHIIEIDVLDSSEEQFLQELGIDPTTEIPVTLVLAPPNILAGRFFGPTTRSMLVQALISTLTQCRPGSGCCGQPET